MAKKPLQEAARLYFENLDVLDNARDELTSALNDFWDVAWPMIQERLADDGEKAPYDKENKSTPGKITLYYGKKERKELRPGKDAAFPMELWIWDPRESDDSSCYSVRLRCSKVGQQRMEEASPGAKAAIEELATSRGLQLDWDAPKKIVERQIAVDSSDLMATWEDVADTVAELLGLLREGYDLVTKSA